MELTARDGRVLLLRMCRRDGGSFGDFRWPMTVGAEVEAPDWNTRAECGGGLHGLRWACGDWGLLSGEVHMVFSADPADVVDIDRSKSKVRRARVEFVGSLAGALAHMVASAALALTRGEVDPRLLPGSGDGYGDGSGSGYGSGYGSGDGSGYGYGDGSGYGYGDGSGSGSGYGDGSGYGSGYGDGSGSGADIVEAAA